VQYVRHTRLDTRDDDADPETLSEDSTLYFMDAAGSVQWQRHVDGARRVTWVGRFAARNVVVVQGDAHWFARAYDDAGETAWETALPDDALEPTVDRSLPGRMTTPTAALVEGDRLRIVRLFAETLILDGDGQLATTPPLATPPALDVSPVATAASLTPLADGGAVLFGRPAGDAQNHQTLIARYDAGGALAWQTTVAMLGRVATLRSDHSLALTGFAGDEFTSTDQRLMVFDAGGTTIVDAAIAPADQQLSEVMIPLADGALALHGQSSTYQPDAFHLHTLTVDAQGAVVSHVDTPLPYMIQHGFDDAGRMAYSDVEHATAGVGQLDPTGVPVP